MQEICQSGSEGGGAGNRSPYPYFIAVAGSLSGLLVCSGAAARRSGMLLALLSTRRCKPKGRVQLAWIGYKQVTPDGVMKRRSQQSQYDTLQKCGYDKPFMDVYQAPRGSSLGFLATTHF